jgi:iron complex outermembrane receptor protein
MSARSSPRTSDSFEAGIKSQLLDHRVMLNGTVFHVKYDDYQAQGIDTIGGTQNFRLTNVGKVLTKGVEIEATAIATKELRFNASVAYVDAKITSFPKAACWPGQTAAQGCVAGSPSFQNLKGATLPNAPKWKLNVGMDLTQPIGDYEMLFSAPTPIRPRSTSR